MCSQQSDSKIKRMLKSLCCDNGWSYGVFWGFDSRNSLLLTMQDAYYEEQMGVLIDDMLPQVHMLGEGMIGQAAFTKKHRWLFSDAQIEEFNPSGSFGHIFQDDSVFHRQFSSGIKTLVVISVEQQGVVHFGSTQKLPERIGFVDQTKRLFQEIEGSKRHILSENEPSSLYNQFQDSSGLCASLVISESSYVADFNPMEGAGYNDVVEIASPQDYVSSHLKSQMQIAGAEEWTMLNRFSAQLDQSCSLPSTLTGNSTVQTPCFSTWSGADSTLSSIKQQAPPGGHTYQNSLEDLKFSLLYGTGASVDLKKTSQCSSYSTTYLHSAPFIDVNDGKNSERPSLCPFEELEHAIDTTAASKPSLQENKSHWFASLEDQSNSNLSHEIRLMSISSNSKGVDNLNNVSVSCPANSVHSSITDNFGCNGKANYADSSVENKVSDSFALNFEGMQPGNWDDILMSVQNWNKVDFSADNSCISEQQVGSKAGPWKGLFSNLGLEKLLDTTNSAVSSVVGNSYEDQLSSASKKRRTSASLVRADQVQLTSLPCFSANVNPVQPLYNLGKTSNPGPKKLEMPKSESGLRIGDNYSKKAGDTLSQPKRHEEPSKATKKKAKPGTRPRPKDRQQIHDRMIELRELIPNGEKMSIDCLLDQTIKHMIFLRSVAKHADRLKQAVEPCVDIRELQKDISNTSSGGVTWACEIGEETMVCPLIVKDLSPAGHTLIEMICEDQGFFLEIADIIRGFSLNILKGVMEVRKDKIWARFTVEMQGKKHVTRHEIFSSLVQLLQRTGPSGVNTSSQLGNTTKGESNLFNNYQQSTLTFPVSLVDTFCHPNL